MTTRRPAWPWAVLAVVAPALPLLLDLPSAFTGLAHQAALPRTAASQAVSGAWAVSLPGPFTVLFTRVTDSGLAIVVPAVAFLVPAAHRRRALVTACAVLGVLGLAAVCVSATAATGDSVRAGVLAVCYAGAIAAAVRAYRLSGADPVISNTP